MPALYPLAPAKMLDFRSQTSAATAVALIVSLAACGDDPKPDDPVDTGTDTDATEDVGADADVGDAADADIDTAADTDAGDDADAEDSGADADATDAADVDPLIDEWPPIDRSEVDPDADPDAWQPGTELPEGEARVGRVAEDTRPFRGPEARCTGGDLVLANQYVRACIAGLDPPSQYTYRGGYIVDLATGETGGEMIEAIVPSEGLRTLAATAIDVIRDGSDGGDAVVRVLGHEAPVAPIGNFVGEIITGVPLLFETEYRLGPDDHTVEAVTWVRADDPELVRRRIQPGDIVVAGDHVTAWAPGFGAIAARFATATDHWYGVSATWAYGMEAEGMNVTALAPGLLDSDIDPNVLTDGVVGPNTEANYVRRYGVARDTFGLDAIFGLTPEGATPVSFSGAVDEAHTEPRYEIATSDGDVVGVLRLDDDGGATIDLPAGSYTATWWGRSDEASITAFDVPATDPVALSTPEVGLLRVWVEEPTDGDPIPSPARVRVSGPESGEHFVERGALAIPLVPGAYTVEISRGEEFEYIRRTDVVVPAGGEVMESTSLRRLMDTEGWVSGDMHQHQRRSLDSEVENTDRVAGNLAAGVDFFGPSDHDAIENFQQIVEDMGVDDLLHTFQGIEVSPAFGHLNAFPARPDRQGAVALSYLEGRQIVQRDAPQLVADARARGAQLIQVNHPRESSPYFSSAEYDPLLGPTTVDSDFWPVPFDTVEVVNGAEEVCICLRDWFSLLSHGLRVAGVGNSDTHGRGGVGWPRNYVASSTDDPASLTNDILVDSMLDLAVSVSGGIFIDFPDGELPGDTVEVDGEATEFSIRVRLQSPTWASPDKLIAFVNGVEVWRESLDDTIDEDILDINGVMTVPIEGDSHVVFWAESSGRQGAVNPGKHIFGFTNPIFVDVGGDGWEAPGVASPEEAPMPVNLTFCPSE